ncbi:YHS domain protein [Devosia equisanguinis]|uniref:YHS domain protein n=2 Tax=Devosiaceae TaxID=2831106 RepID=A0A447I9X9_9HYPH|nr:YHS domain protein [Devosia equisanguinis]
MRQSRRAGEPIIGRIMTQTSKQILTMIALLLPLFGPVPAMITAAQAQSVVSIIVTDPLTGYAIGGMDPVSYFTEPGPLAGRPELELKWKGVPWLFASAANMEIFKRNPELYSPQYGGYGAMSMARGFLSEANPSIYTVYKQRLFLFYSASNREAFLLSPDAAALRGEENWQALSKTLTTR